MRRGRTVCAPVESCLSSALTAPSQRFASIQLLDRQVLHFVVEPKSRTKDLYLQACAHLSAQGMVDTQLFGLAIELDGEYVFVDLDYKLSKYAPKSWRSSSTQGLDINGKPLLNFHLKVQFYVESPLLLRDEISRHFYYLQLRQNVISRTTLHVCGNEEVLYLLSGLALQADFGDYNEAQHSSPYFQLSDYFPPHMLSDGSEQRLFQTAANLHQHNRSLSKESAENEFIREASSSDNCLLPYNSHLYRLKQRKSDASPGNVSLAISTTGIMLFEESTTKTISGNFQWNNIGKLCFDRKKFEIRGLLWPSSGEKLVYYTSSDEKSKHLLYLCRITHQFCMTIHPRLSEIQRKEEDDLDLDLILDTPHAAFAENLTSAHLRDNLNSCESLPSRFTNCQVDASREVSDLSFVKVKQSVPTSSALADGSQCSSSGSTVVVTNPVSVSEDVTLTNRRQPSTNSSLELGFSHTAENSVVSDGTSCCLELDYSVQSAHTSSGIYTSRSRSSCETNTVANTTLAYSSETSGICHTSIDDAEGPRSRSGSIVSTSESFHGDGSDPSDAGRGALLTADELSDLIVKRSPKPRRGVYPSRATVSSTLDSDSDYVTLPPPPLPPSRSEQMNIGDLLYLQSKAYSSSPSNRLMSLECDQMENSFSQLSLSLSSLKGKTDPWNESVSSANFQVPQLPLASTHSIPYQRNTPPYIISNCSNVVSPAPPVVSIINKTSYSYPNNQNLHASLSLAPEKSESNKPNIEKNNLIEFRQQFHSPLSSTTDCSPRFISPNPSSNMLIDASVTTSSGAPNWVGSGARYHPAAINAERLSLSTNLPVRNCNIDRASRMKVKHELHDALAPHGNLIPIVGSNNYLDVRGSGAAYLQQIHQVNPPPPPQMPVRQSHVPLPHPPLPPPPPRPTLATVYTSQVTRSQIEQFKQQLLSDVDYVIYPMQDPTISKQEYIDSKLLQHYNEMYAPPPYPSYPSVTGKSRVIYRSTPNVAVAGNCIPLSFSNHVVGRTQKFASNQNLTLDYSYPGSTYSYLSSHPSSTSPMYSATASYSSSSQSLCFDPLSYHLSVPKVPVLPPGFSRTRSDNSILNCLYEESLQPSEATIPKTEESRIRRPPPPPPPLPANGIQTNINCDFQVPKTSAINQSSSFVSTKQYVQAICKNPICAGSSVVSTLLKTAAKETNKGSSSTQSVNTELASTKNGKKKESANGMLDIRTLREKSRNLDLPLISALCNDKSLLKQTNAFVLPKHPSKKLKKNVERPLSWHVSSNTSKTLNVAEDKFTENTPNKRSSLFSSLLSGKSSNTSSSATVPVKHSVSHSNLSNSKLKYPVSGLSTTQIFKSNRKVNASRHLHPSDNKSVTNQKSVLKNMPLVIVSKSVKMNHNKSAAHVSTNCLAVDKSQKTVLTS